MKIERSVEIDAPSDAVWEVMSDVERWHEWTASISSVELVGGALVPGASARVRQPKLPAMTWTVTAVEHGQAFSWKAKRGGVSALATHAVESIDANHSRARLSIEQSGPMAWFAGLLYGRLGTRYVEMEAAGLKRRSERATGA